MRRTTLNVLAVLLLLTGVASTEEAPTSPEMQATRPATILLVTDASLADAWKPFATWKTALGKATRIVAVQDIAKTYEGGDLQAKIRACVLQHIEEHGTRFVILGGDSEPGGKGLVPDRDTPHAVMGGRLSYPDIPTDLYYISTGDWDADADGVYGEWKDDAEAIRWTHPKAVLGRIPVRSAADVKAYTDKVIGYESRYPARRFAQQMVYTCPEQHAYPKLKTSREAVLKSWDGGDVQDFFAHRTPWDDSDAPGSHALSPGNLQKLFASGSTGKFHIHGHGFLPVWVLEDKQTFGMPHIKRLVHENAYPVVTTVSCFTGQFDGAKDPSITEAMLRQPKGGAIAIIAPSREGVPIFSDRRDFRLMMTEGKLDGTTQTLTRFWTHGLRDNLTVGEAFRRAKIDMEEAARKHHGYHWVQSELNLLGDPSLDMRARDPQTPKPKAPASIPSGEHVIVLSAGAPHATVCLWKGDEIYLTVKADAKGEVRAEIGPHTPGLLLATVSGPNLNVVSVRIRLN